MRKFLKKNGILSLLSRLIAKIRLSRFTNREEIFTNIYTSQKWKGGGEETVSGGGSTLTNTKKIRQEIENLLIELQVKSIVDAPCGDFNWFRYIKRENDINYIGVDIVEDLISSNQQRFGNSNTNFIKLDIVNQILPDADIWICRDCLLHLSTTDIKLLIHNFINSNINYFLVTNHSFVKENIDIPTGHCRPVNLEIYPFCLPKPSILLEDSDSKVMAVWKREDIQELILDPDWFQ